MSKLPKMVAYLRYLLLHKWWVFRKCVARGLIWRGIIHDWSKFLPSTFIAYTNHFHRKNQYRPCADYEVDTCKPEEEKLDEAIGWAWFKHQKWHDHHWQWWICITSKGKHIPMPMSRRAIIEMVCDWQGAGIAQGKPDVVVWYEAHKDGMLLHPETRKRVGEELSRL